ncbi:MAG: response regulator [Pseudomonadota bacterium]
MSFPTVLVVEDEQHTRDILERVLVRDRMLRYQKVQVLTAADGVEALELFEKNSVDLIITDLLMPRMDGFELVKAIRKAVGDTVPILVTTAVVRDQKVLSQLCNTYHVEVVTKPFNLGNLATQVRTILSQRTRKERVSSRLQKTPSQPFPVSQEKRVTEGTFAEASLPELVLNALEYKFSGVIRVQRGNVSKDIYVLSGMPVFVQSNLRAETLGQLLLRRGGITDSQHARVLAYVQKTGRKYGEGLVALNLMSEAQVLVELSAQARFKLGVCMTWRDGTWRLVDDPDVSTKVPHCKIDPASLIFEALKKRADVEKAIGRLKEEASTKAVKLFPRFAKYREKFVAVFGEDLLKTIGDTGCAVVDALRGTDYWNLALQLDVLLHCKLADLEPLPEEKAKEILRVATSVPLEQLAVHDEEPPKEELSQKTPPKESEEVASAKKLIQAAYLGLHSEDHYQVLGVDSDANMSEIKVAYEVRRSRFDPDRFVGLDLGECNSQLHEIGARLEEAFVALSDPLSRELHDKELVSGGMPPRSMEKLFQDEEEFAGENEFPPEPSSDSRMVRMAAVEAEREYAAGEEAFAEGRFGAAEESFGYAANLDGQPEYRAKGALASFLNSDQSPDAAVEAMVQIYSALASDPENVVCYEIAGQISAAMGLYDEAVEHFQTLLRIDPTHCDAFDKMAEMLEDVGKFEFLEAQYRRTLDFLGDQDLFWAKELWSRLGRLYQDRLGQPQKAEQAFEAATRLARRTGSMESTKEIPETGSLGRKTFTDLKALVGDENEFGAGRNTSPKMSVKLDDLSWEKLRHPQDSANLTELFRQLAPIVLDLHPLRKIDEEARQSDESCFSKEFTESLYLVCARLGLETPKIVQKGKRGSEVETVPTKPVVLLVGSEVVSCTDTSELCFRLARALTLVRPGYDVAMSRPVSLLGDYVLAVTSIAYPQIPLPDSQGEVIRIKKALDKNPDLQNLAKEILVSLTNQGEALNLSKWRIGVQRTAERAGLLLCGNLSVARKILSADQPDAAKELSEFAKSESYLDLKNTFV